jgi:signal transduction histidine kinase
VKTDFIGFNTNYEIVTDKMRLQQVLLNYQSNAIKFTPKKGKILIQCSKLAEEGDGLIEIKVIDNGTGIKQADQQKLFQLFGYLDRTKEQNSQGIGLGLYITKMII